MRKTPINRQSSKQASRGGFGFNSTIRQTAKPVKKVNPERQAKRRKKYKAHLSSAAWKKLRLAVFERDGFRCTTIHRVQMVLEFQGEALKMGGVSKRRCEFVDESRTGAGLICDHKTYARFGHENLDDLQTRCTSCDARLTKQERANWTNGRGA